MKRARLWLCNAITAISLLLCAATIAAWVFFSQHPGSSSLEIDRTGAHDFASPYGSGRLHITWIQGAPVGDSEWGWHLSVDGRMLDVQPYFSFYEWRIPWWRLVLLWLVPSFLRFAPWRIGASPDYSPSPPGWRWLLRGPPGGPVAWRHEIKNIAVANCLASYFMAAIYVGLVVMALFNEPEMGRADVAAYGGRMALGVALAPISVPFVVLMLLMAGFGPGFDVGTSMVGIYLLILLAMYLWRTNKQVNIHSIPLTGGI